METKCVHPKLNDVILSLHTEKRAVLVDLDPSGNNCFPK